MYTPKVTKRMIQKRNQNTDDSFSKFVFYFGTYIFSFLLRNKKAKKEWRRL